MFGALFAEPEIFEGSTGEVYGDMTTAQTAPTPTYLNVYETNLGTMVGAITEAQLNTLTPSIGAGLAHTDHMLQMMRLGVRYQNAFSLTQYNFKRSDGNGALLWGIVLDMGKTNLRRPQFLTQAMANSVIGGTMLQTVQLGANPTWNQPLSSDGVILSNAHDLQSFAFQNGNTLSAIVFNLSQTSALPVTFSGPNAPSGSVQMTQSTTEHHQQRNRRWKFIDADAERLQCGDGSFAAALLDDGAELGFYGNAGSCVFAGRGDIHDGANGYDQRPDAWRNDLLHDRWHPTTSSPFTGNTHSGTENLQAMAPLPR